MYSLNSIVFVAKGYNHSRDKDTTGCYIIAKRYRESEQYCGEQEWSLSNPEWRNVFDKPVCCTVSMTRVCRIDEITHAGGRQKEEIVRVFEHTTGLDKYISKPPAQYNSTCWLS